MPSAVVVIRWRTRRALAETAAPECPFSGGQAQGPAQGVDGRAAGIEKPVHLEALLALEIAHPGLEAGIETRAPPGAAEDPGLPKRPLDPPDVVGAVAGFRQVGLPDRGGEGQGHGRALAPHFIEGLEGIEGVVAFQQALADGGEQG